MRTHREVKAALWITLPAGRPDSQSDHVRPVPSVARKQCGVFSTQQALLDGWTHSALRHATLAGRINRVRLGAYQVADLTSLGVASEFESARWRHAAPAIGAVLVTPGAAASHSTAAVLLSIPLIFIPRVPCVTVLPYYTGEVPGVHLHRCKRARLPPDFGTIGCTGIEGTAIDLAREHGVAAGVVALDFALHHKLTTPHLLETEFMQCRRWPGVRRAREAASLSDGRSESVLETRSRLKMAEFGLPAPQLQVRIGNEWSGFVARVDFYWDELGIVGEADGAVKYDGSDPEPLQREKSRQEKLEDLGLEIVRWGSADLRHFEAVVRRFNNARRRASRRSASDRAWRVLPPP